MLKLENTQIAPIVLIVFRRPETTKLVFEEIRKVRPTKLYIIADGPREGNFREKELVSLTRSVVEDVDWPCDVKKIYSDHNIGLRQRIFSGLDKVFSVESSAIILEDDCLPSQSFFAFCSNLLVRYRNESTVTLLSGSNFAPAPRAFHDYFFSRNSLIWGWATWADSWQEFRSTPQKEEWSNDEKKALSSSFSSRIQRKEFFHLMDIAKNLNTWDVSLAVWMRQFGKLSVIPKINMIENIGFGAEATHTKFEAFDVQIARSDFTSANLTHPESIALRPEMDKRMWRVKSLKWLVFPLAHPFSFVSRLWRFFTATKN